MYDDPCKAVRREVGARQVYFTNNAVYKSGSQEIVSGKEFEWRVNPFTKWQTSFDVLKNPRLGGFIELYMWGYW